MSLAPGSYYIISLATGQYIGREGREDRSLRPKRVVQIPDPQVWRVEKTYNGYRLSIGSDPTAVIDKQLYAILMDFPPPETWNVEKYDRGGAGEYIITTQSRYAGWVVDTSEISQVQVRPLIVGPSLPPFYPPNEVFKFVPAEEE